MPFLTPRRGVLIAGVAAALLVFAWAAVVIAVAVTGGRDEREATDAIAVLGAAQYNGRPSPVFRARLDHAATLYRAGLAPVVLVTGGVGAGDTLSEAEVGRRYLLGLGLPPHAAIALPAGADTYASVAEVAGWFRGRGSRQVLLVSDAFHLLRLRIIAARLGLVPYTSAAPTSPIRASRRRHTAYLLAEGVKVPITWLFQR
jgi:uncharacterized SAM-binding protein YcdF (DUF218 family)